MSTPSVFVLDDDVAVCRVINRMLSLEEYQVRTSQSVKEAVNAIEEKSFDAYVLDYRLGDGTGLDVAERLRSRGNNAPIILISGYDLSGIASQAEKLGVSDIIEKPFSVDTLYSTLKQLIRPAPVVDPSTSQVEPKVAEPIAAKKRSTKAVRISAIILLIILAGIAIYLLIAGP